MGQIVSSAAKPKRCNLNKLSQLGTPAAGEYILVSSDNSMNAAGQGYFDAYIVGEGNKAATALELHKFKAEELDVQINGVDDEVITVSVPATAGTIITNATRYDCHLKAGKTYTLVYTGTIKNISVYFRDSSDSAAGVYADGETTTRTQFSMTTGITTRTIIPSVDIYYVKFYATAANVPNTETAYFVFTWESTDTGLVGRVSTIEEKMVDKETLSNYVEVSRGKNLYDASTKTEGKFFNTSGVINGNASYNISDFIPVEASTTYCISDSANSYVGSASACHVLYDADKTKLSVVTGDNKTLTTTENTAYIRISILSAKSDIQVEEGSERTSYEEYSPIGGYPSIITNDSVGFDQLTDDVITAINSVTPITFNSLRGSTTLAASGVMTLAKTHVLKNSLLSALVSGTIEQVSIGVGYSTNSSFDYRSYMAHWVSITQSQVLLYAYYNNGWVLVNTYTHGLTLTSKTFVEVDTIVTTSQASTLRIYNDLGELFEQTLPSWGVGIAFATNDGSASLDISLSFMPRDITHNVWCFGDSYFNFTTADKWTYHAMKAGFANWLANSQPGLSPDSAYTDLQNLLALGYRPSYVVWCLGMNGATTESQSGGDYVINSAQKAVIDNVVTLCDNNNIIPVFGTIPTVPERQKTGFCSYIRTLGKRYIDFAEAVGANSSGVWNTGLLSSDNVHPTAAGAKVLFAQVLIDFPEISIVE